MKRWALWGIGLLLAPLVASAANDGELATSSRGQIGVSVDLAAAPVLIRISGLDDVNFDKTVGDNALTDQTVEACVFMDSSGTYTVEVNAEPLGSGSEHYPYGLRVYNGGLNAGQLDLSILDQSVSGSVEGLMASSSETCTDLQFLKFTFEDDGASAVTEPFSAAAVVNITVTPD